MSETEEKGIHHREHGEEMWASCEEREEDRSECGEELGHEGTVMHDCRMLPHA